MRSRWLFGFIVLPVMAGTGFIASRWFSTDVPEEFEPAALLTSAVEHRVALVLGNNQGAQERPALRYAELDARKLGGVLVELGGFEASATTVLLGGTRAAVLDQLRKLTFNIQALKRRHERSRVVLAFYYSGHSDGVALELGDDRLRFSELRDLLRQTGADIRLGIIDACRSGAIIGTKGGKPGPGFELATFGLPSLSGEVFVSSSRADELALESREIAGSFFTHHFVSGLRGAADADRDSQVSLEEVYRYTATRTSSAAAGSLYGGQTPAYDYRMVGQGDLILTDLREVSRLIYVPGGFDRVMILDETDQLAVAETYTQTAQLIALPVGSYLLRGTRNDRWYRARVSVEEGVTRFARALDFLPESEPTEVPPGAPSAHYATPGTTFDAPLSKSDPNFCNGTDGNWKACRGSGCQVCAELLEGFPNYFRNHANCIPSLTCKGRYFTCSANCPPPGAEDSCDPVPNSWSGCEHGCAVCVEEIGDYPRYFENHPNCIPMVGSCRAAPGMCGAACPKPGPGDK
ncbi:MAG: hypothetical protein RJA70_2748 [Pseudomonadota bacterium]|jgi:hypothetical protein